MSDGSSPGVPVEERQPGPRPIEGVGTSTAGFAGITERGPEYPCLTASWLEYQRWFGGGRCLGGPCNRTPLVKLRLEERDGSVYFMGFHDD